MSKTFEDVWQEVELTVQDAKAIAWDTCHKIYVLMDDNQVEVMRGYEYDPLITASEMSPAVMLETLKKWYYESCPLRFINAVETNEENPNAGFSDLIPQGYEGEFCDNCGEFGSDYDGICDDCREDEEEEEE